MVSAGGLGAFLALREKCLALYQVAPDEPNAIQNQIHLMLLSEMSYRVAIAEHRTEESDMSDLPVLGHLLESGYFSTQILAVRRLIDRGDDAHSVIRIIADLEKNRARITREAFVTFDATPYEPPPLVITHPGLQEADSPFSLGMRSRRRHELFDRLSHVDPSQRSPTDVINPLIFKRLRDWLIASGGEDLRAISTAYLAHALDKKKRGDFAPQGLDFIEIESAQRAIVRVTRAIFDVILQGGTYSPVVPMVPLGYFGTVWQGNSMVVSTNRMHTKWDELAAVRNSWSEDIEKDLCAK